MLSCWAGGSPPFPPKLEQKVPSKSRVPSSHTGPKPPLPMGGHNSAAAPGQVPAAPPTKEQRRRVSCNATPPAATSPPSRWLPSRLMRGLMKISGGPLLCSVQSGAEAALAGGTPWAGGEGAAGAWPRSVPTGGGLPGCSCLPSKHWQMGATSRVGERVGCDLPARERNIFTVVGGWVCIRLPSAVRSPRGCRAHPACPGVSQPHSTHPWQ